MLAGVKNESFLPGKGPPLARRKGSLASLGASTVDVKLLQQIKDKEAEHQTTKDKFRESQEQVQCEILPINSLAFLACISFASVLCSVPSASE